MRGRLGALALFIAIAVAAGCAKDKYHMRPAVKEEAILPPDEKRYNEPDTATWKKPPPAKEEKTLLGRPGPGMGSGGLGGFGP